MKPYGIPTIPDSPDIADIQEYGLKSSAGRCFKANGEYKSYIRSSKNRKRIRRIYKRRERKKWQKYILNDTNT